MRVLETSPSPFATKKAGNGQAGQQGNGVGLFTLLQLTAGGFKAKHKENIGKGAAGIPAALRILCRCSVLEQVRWITCPVSTVKSQSHVPADAVTVRGDPNSCHSYQTQRVPFARGDSIPAG